MKTVKLVTLILSGFLFVQLQAQNTNGNIEKKEERKVIIIKKTIDEDGNEVTEKIVKEGNDADNIFFLDDDGKKVEIDIEEIEKMTGEDIDWKSEGGKKVRIIKHSQTIEVDDEGEDKHIKIMMSGDGDANVFQWDSEGDIPDDIKKELAAKGIELEEMEDMIRIKTKEKSKMKMSNPNTNVEVSVEKNENGNVTTTTITTITKNGETEVTKKVEKISKEKKKGKM